MGNRWSNRSNKSIMAENQQPGKYDAVLGGENPPPVYGSVLGGIEGVKRRLSNPVEDVKLAALSDALNYQEAGLNLVIQALQGKSKRLERYAYKLLRKRKETQVKQVLEHYQPWDLFERLQGYIGYQGQHAGRFANRYVEDYSSESGIENPENTAYALRWDYDGVKRSSTEGNRPSIAEQITSISQDSRAGKLEALIIGLWADDTEVGSDEIVNRLVDAKNKLTNLEAIFIGDIHYQESEISWIAQSDISPILRAYPQLKVLQIRGGERLQFSPPVRHNNLQTLIVETGGLSSETVAQICNLNLPALEHLELWLGADEYGGDCTVIDIKPILEDLIFPDLSYLGLRNSQFADDIAEAVIKSDLIKTISVLDLSLGNLTDKGAEILLNCSDVNELDILNVSEARLSEKMICKLAKLDCRLLADKQETDNDYDDEYRYCAVTE
ncbi:leucine rich repeat variant [Calothrix parasitica NIES-267]|uniref:Leucine rich repeat variant n=1 Tax=Calothrix parasitica NIES-267 TaxID=1973488 RepID=A0A1Z4LMZ1_9CYAN|nr:leucine rich repeat variant [Calothrix parasitica NIES-267]